MARYSRETEGRYGLARARTPGALPKEGVHKSRPQLDIVHGVVDDPNPSFRGERQRAAVNKNTDALEREHKNGRVSDAGYRAGRAYQLVLERSGGSATGGGQWVEGDRVDAVLAHEVAIVRNIDRARATVSMLDDTAKVVGLLGQKVLELVLLKRRTLEQVCTDISGRDDKLARSFYAHLFRHSLEALADHWSSRASRWPRT
jgi:hypothetical protein